MNLTEIIAKATRTDSALEGFNPTDLPEAARYRLALLASCGNFDSKFGWEIEIPALVALRVEPAETFTERPEACDPWSYLVFSDGSLYYANNAADDVWADARDFITERLLRDAGKDAAEYEPESAEGRLIRAHAANLLSDTYL